MRAMVLYAGDYKLCMWGGKKTQGNSWPKWFGNSKTAGELRQAGPVLAVDSHPVFHMPLDIVVSEEKSNDTKDGVDIDDEKKKIRKAYAMRLIENESGFSSVPMEYLFSYPVGAGFQKTPKRWWAGKDFMEAYLGKTDLTPFSCTGSTIAEEDLWQTEMRVNVGIDPSSRAGKEGVLFSLNHVRTNPKNRVSLLSRWSGPEEAFREIENVLSRKNAAINLGGERRAAIVEKRETDFIPPFLLSRPEKENDRLYFKIYFATPAYFENGWLPKEEAGQFLLQSDSSQVSVRILAAAVGKPISLGGYNVKKQRERSIRRFIPSGSVYYCMAGKEDYDVIQRLHGEVIGDDEFFRHQGFGLAFIGSLEPSRLIDNQSQNESKGEE
jgi:CRISPR-associated protein Cmr3